MYAANQPSMTFLSGGGEMGDRIRQFDWSRTVLGTADKWPQSLKNALGMILQSRYQMFVWWGPQFIKFYNDPYRSALGNRHPDALGRRASEVWSDIWDTVGPQAELVLFEGKSTWHENQLLVMERYGYPEETFFSYSYSPVPAEDGRPGGVFCVCNETTDEVIGGRRLAALRQLSAATASAKSPIQACETAAQVLRDFDRDISFALFYLLEDSGEKARLVASTGIAAGTSIAAETVNLKEPSSPSIWSFREALNGSNVKQSDLSSRVKLPGGPWPEATETAMVLPLKSNLEQPIGFLVLGASPRRPFDDNYEGFFELVAGNVVSAITNARAYDEERRRAQQLAALDKAKTVFFSNVSHELRTPLTLMLGPLEEVLTNRLADLPPEAAGNLELAHRNSLRLLKLVNTLLDFARIEAGRIEANYEPTDLAAYTIDLVSLFRSAIEKAGLTLELDCPPLPEQVFVDRDMWEKIVLNLVSNAFKFTFHGGIKVALTWWGERVELTVSDTGAGIPADDLSRIFERFQRVRGTQSRTQEGTGIGLALVQELAHLHGGEVKVRSTEGQGSQFVVSIQTGKAHLPAEHIRSSRRPGGIGTMATFFKDETLRWLPHDDKKQTTNGLHPTGRPGPKSTNRILLADDNADMRDYVKRLLNDHFEIETAPDGEAALEAINNRPPDLILADVMMPRLDGFGLLREIRRHEMTRAIPFILVSARAGEESRLEGLDAGADDYLVKPFSARELVARVQSQLDLARLRKEGEERVTRILDSITDGFHVVDREGKFVELNAAAKRMYKEQGIDIENIVGKSVFEIFPEARNLHSDGSLVDALNRHSSEDAEIYYPPWKRWYFVRRRPLPEGAIGTFFQDITERKTAEIAVRKSEEQLRAYVNASSDVVYRMSPDWKEMRELYGREFVADTPEPNRNWLEKYIHPNDRERVLSAINAAIHNKSVFELEHRVIRKDGSLGWTFSRAIPLIDDNGQIKEWFGAASDVSEQKSAQEALRASEKHLELVSNSIPSLLCYIDRDYRYRSCNRAYCEWFNKGRDDIIGKQLSQVVGDADWRRIKPEIDKALAGNIVEFDRELAIYSGEKRWVHAVYTPHKADSEHVSGIVILVTDITHRKQAEEELKAAQETLREHATILERTVFERTVRLRETVTELESFSYSIAHDMRAPLRSMRGYAGILNTDYGDKLPSSAKDYLRRISSSAERMDALIQDVLDYSKVVRGDIVMQPVDTERLTREIIESYPDFQAPRATILVQTPLPGVYANSAALTQIISNLLGNAVKFVAPNTVPRIIIRSEISGDIVRLWFEDNGIGIPPHGVDRIFKMFQRLHPVNVYEGTGIGLAIIRKAVDRMGGRVGVESELGKGSRFWVELKKA